MINEIISGKHINESMGVPNSTARIQKMYNTLKARGQVDVDIQITVVDEVNWVAAFIDTGRWGAQCECGGAEYVEPDDPVFWCFSCGNMAFGGALRRVHFPDDMADIELLLLERPISVHKGMTKIQKVFNSQPLTSARREWHVGDTIKKLKDDNKKADLENDLKKIEDK